MTNAVHRRPGRPPGATNTRDPVLAAARRAFTEKGYDAASLRQIAGDAGVDQGMVRHFFADKAGLFRAAMELSVDPQAMLPGLLAGGREDLGERLVRWFLEQWDEAGEHRARRKGSPPACNSPSTARAAWCGCRPPTTAGMPYSRATTAPWLFAPLAGGHLIHHRSGNRRPPLAPSIPQFGS